MTTGYNNNHKAYRLVDVDTNQLSFSKDFIVDEEVGPFHTSSKIKITKQQPISAKDSGIKLQVAPPVRGEILSMRSFWDLILLIPIQV
jgi:hypothetical protein